MKGQESMRERLKNLRVMEAREMYLQAQLEQLPTIHPKRTVILAQIEADRKERDAVYKWIESIPNDKTANIFALRYVKNARWQEIADIIGGSVTGVKKRVFRFLAATEKQERESESGKESAE